MTLLLEADEPEALLGSLKLIAERKAHQMFKTQIKSLNEDPEALRWYKLVEAIEKVDKELKDKQDG